MIAIIRPAAPAFLIDPASKWAKETQAAIAWYAHGPQPMGSFPFVHYGDERVKNALKDFILKCAYCDSHYRGTSDGDVEHFRPKGKVKEKDPQSPGYYWLANEWDNLLLSCQHCNQNRRHILIDDDSRIGRGKLDQFPLLHNRGWITGPQDNVNQEEPFRLLLNPCLDNPENHLRYDFESADIVGSTDKGSKSIEVYVLRRKELVDDRMLVLLQLKQAINLAKDQLDLYNEFPTARNQESLDKHIDYLVTYAEPGRSFAGMSRYFIRKFFRDNNIG